MEDFVHLNVHTHFSIGGGLSRVRELVDKAIVEKTEHAVTGARMNQ